LFRKINDLVRKWLRKPREAMKEDAFDDVRCPFDYKAELKKAREALNTKVLECASRDWKIGYRELAKRFKMSPSALYAIAKGCKAKSKPGPRRWRRPDRAR
jgi:hypothetical protein